MAYERFRGLVDESDDITRVIAVLAFVLLVAITLPAFVPQIPPLAYGATCTNLYSPKGNGNQQSYLARGLDATALRIDLSLPQNPIVLGQSVTLNVRFTNQGSAPITLALIPEEAVLRFNSTENGIMFFIEATNGTELKEPAASRGIAPIRTQFTSDQLHLLNPHQHCTQGITIPAQRLAATGLNPGQYQFIAVYRNNSRGVLAPIGAFTPTPVFPDQGVWATVVEGVRSRPVVLTVSSPAK